MDYINQHFIFNALNTLKCKIMLNSKDAAQSVDDFAKYLRYVCNIPELTQTVSFREEVEVVRAYSRLEISRFSQLHVEYELEKEDFPVLPMCLLPLMENAIHHGICRRREPGTILLRSSYTEGNYQIEISDNGCGFEPDQVVSDGNRVGSLAEIALRMEQTGYGTMEIDSESNRGTRIVLRFPDCC